MAYPLSSNVSAGDPTLSAHYNNLRSDALLLGQPAADVVNLSTLLERYESRLSVERLSTDRIRVPASAAAPVSLMILGFMVQATANVDLAAADKPAGAAADYYIFANRVAGSTTFTLTVSTSPTETAGNMRLIGRFYWDGAAIVKDSVRTEQSVLIKSLLYYVEPQVCQGRLTLSTGVPVPVADVSGSANVYFTPYTGGRIALYAQSYGWRIYPFAELTLSIAAVDISKNLDIWVYDNAGTLTLAYTEWSNDTLRATALARQDGVLVKSGAPSYRYLGTVRTSAAGEVCDQPQKRFVWNYYNRVERSLLITVTDDSWTYTDTWNTWRALANSTNVRVTFVIGVDETVVNLYCNFRASNSGANHFAFGICLDATNANHAQIIRGQVDIATDAWLGANYISNPGAGFHFLQVVEQNSAGTLTGYGDRGLPDYIQGGAIGTIIM